MAYTMTHPRRTQSKRLDIKNNKDADYSKNNLMKIAKSFSVPIEPNQNHFVLFGFNIQS